MQKCFLNTITKTNICVVFLLILLKFVHVFKEFTITKTENIDKPSYDYN